MSLKRLLYSIFLYLVFPLVLARLLWRSRVHKGYRQRLNERLGMFMPKPAKPVIWVHAVSVGEAIAAKPLIEALLSQYPEHTILVTTTTPTGSDRVQAMFRAALQSGQLIHRYFPYDLLGAVARFVRCIQPRILIVVETEIWPNLYAKCAQRHIPILMVNARLSEKSVQSYRKVHDLIAETLQKVSVIAVRSAVDAQRFQQLGADETQIKQVGNIKFDIRIDEAQQRASQESVDHWNRGRKNKRLVFVAASTHAGEDAMLVFAYLNLRKLFPELLLLLVPRHPERFDAVYELCKVQVPKHLTVYRHSDAQPEKTHQADIILGDSMGEMQRWYAAADVVFIGGSLVPTGGHNPLEATVFGVPVVSGPHLFNFDDIAGVLRKAGLLFVCDDEFELSKQIAFLLEQQAMKTENGKSEFSNNAEVFMQQHRGVTARLLKLIAANLRQ